MSHLMLVKIAAIAAGIFAFTLPKTVNADPQQYSTKIIATSTSPVALTHCVASQDAIGSVYVDSSAVNRSSIFLTSYVVRWYAFDHSGVGMGQQDYTYTFQSDLAPNDVTQSVQGVYFLTESLSALASVSCRMESAKFEGGRSWTYGRPWSGHLSPLPHQASSRERSTVVSRVPVQPAASNGASVSAGHVEATVTNAWNDMVNGLLFVHVALDVQAADAEATIGPQNVSLTMGLVGGARRTYQSIDVAAPTYQKLDPLGQNSSTQLTYEVDPKEDLGALGFLHVAAHTKTHVVATFRIGSDGVTNPNDNRQVVVR